MSRPLRVQFPGAVSHAMARGNDRRPIYSDDHDRTFFVDLLWHVAERFDWEVLAYCLMPNHYHLIVRTLQPTLARGMRDLNGRYAQYLNSRYGRVGHVFQGRYFSRLIDEDRYLLAAIRYVLLNPIRSNLCTKPEQWRWSSYRSAMGQAAQAARLATEGLLRWFHPDLVTARLRFASFVEAGIGQDDPGTCTRIPTVLADDQLTAVLGRVAPAPSSEVPRAARAFKSLDQYQAEAHSRNAAIHAAYSSGTYTLAEIGRHFGLRYASISRIVKKYAIDHSNQDLTP